MLRGQSHVTLYNAIVEFGRNNCCLSCRFFGLVPRSMNAGFTKSGVYLVVWRWSNSAPLATFPVADRADFDKFKWPVHIVTGSEAQWKEPGA